MKSAAIWPGSRSWAMCRCQYVRQLFRAPTVDIINSSDASSSSLERKLTFCSRSCTRIGFAGIAWRWSCLTHCCSLSISISPKRQPTLNCSSHIAPAFLVSIGMGYPKWMNNGDSNCSIRIKLQLRLRCQLTFLTITGLNAPARNASERILMEMKQLLRFS